MAYMPFATEVTIPYTLTSPNGSIAVFNDPTSANYVGALTEITGLDSPEVRESTEDLVEADGGSHGAFYFSRRPILLTARVFNAASVLERSTRIDRARRASLAMRADANLSWTTSAGVAMFVPVRRQQPLRESGGWVKELQIALVSQYATLFGSTLNSINLTGNGAAVAAENKGSYPSYGVLTVTGPGAGTATNVQFVNQTDSNRTFKTTGLTLAANEVVQFDLLNHSGVFTVGARAGQSANRYIDFSLTDWPALLTGSQSMALTSTGSTTATFAWRDTWV